MSTQCIKIIEKRLQVIIPISLRHEQLCQIWNVYFVPCEAHISLKTQTEKGTKIIEPC